MSGVKILGIVGSARDPAISGCHKLAEIVLENTGCDYELISVGNKNIGGCIACLGCVEDNICKLNDDFNEELRQKIVDCDGYVIAAPNHFSTMNVHTHAFLERWYQFRHKEKNDLWGKLGVAIGVGGSTGDLVCLEIQKFFLYNKIETVDRIPAQGAASCYDCGYGETCEVGMPVTLHGGNLDFSEPDVIPDVSKQYFVVDKAIEAGENLGSRLRDEKYDREIVAMEMDEKMKKIVRIMKKVRKFRERIQKLKN